MGTFDSEEEARQAYEEKSRGEKDKVKVSKTYTDQSHHLLLGSSSLMSNVAKQTGGSATDAASETAHAALLSRVVGSNSATGATTSAGTIYTNLPAAGLSTAKRTEFPSSGVGGGAVTAAAEAAAAATADVFTILDSSGVTIAHARSLWDRHCRVSQRIITLQAGAAQISPTLLALQQQYDEDDLLLGIAKNAEPVIHAPQKSASSAGPKVAQGGVIADQSDKSKPSSTHSTSPLLSANVDDEERYILLLRSIEDEVALLQVVRDHLERALGRCVDPTQSLINMQSSSNSNNSSLIIESAATTTSPSSAAVAVAAANTAAVETPTVADSTGVLLTTVSGEAAISGSRIMFDRSSIGSSNTTTCSSNSNSIEMSSSSGENADGGSMTNSTTGKTTTTVPTSSAALLGLPLPVPSQFNYTVPSSSQFVASSRQLSSIATIREEETAAAGPITAASSSQSQRGATTALRARVRDKTHILTDATSNAEDESSRDAKKPRQSRDNNISVAIPVLTTSAVAVGGIASSSTAEKDQTNKHHMAQSIDMLLTAAAFMTTRSNSVSSSGSAAESSEVVRFRERPTPLVTINSSNKRHRLTGSEDKNNNEREDRQYNGCRLDDDDCDGDGNSGSSGDDQDDRSSSSSSPSTTQRSSSRRGSGAASFYEGKHQSITIPPPGGSSSIPSKESSVVSKSGWTAKTTNNRIYQGKNRKRQQQQQQQEMNSNT